MNTSRATTPHRHRLFSFEGEKADALVSVSLFDLFWIFVIMSVVGLVGESIVSLIQDGFYKNRAGVVWGPFSPIYGAGAALMVIVVGKVKPTSGAGVFVACALAGGSLEFLTGLVLKHAFGLVAWNYVSHPLNFWGYTSVPMMLIWGSVGVAWICGAYPYAKSMVDRIPRGGRDVLTKVFFLFMLANVLTTVLAWDAWFERQVGNPIDTPVEQLFADQFSDQFMEDRFQTMSMWTDMATRPR